jgi:hypothetical protein
VILVRRRLPFVVALALTLALGAAPGAHARPARDIAGVALHPWQLQSANARERVFAGVAATGARWVRVDFPWSLVEYNRGHHGWGQLDAIVAAADRHRLRLLPMVAYVPPWASASGELWAYPDSDAF